MAAGSGTQLNLPEGEPASRPLRISFGAYLILLNLALLYLLFKVWPGKVPSSDDDLLVSLLWGKIGFSLSLEKRYLLIVMLSGALGSYIHTATSFADFVGNRRFCVSWTWWYTLRPFIGTALATIVYFSVRGGLISGGTGAENLSPYGVAAIAGLAGMFSKQATDKLKEVFETLFKTDQAPPRSDGLAP
jgi:hypothetical protein